MYFRIHTVTFLESVNSQYIYIYTDSSILTTEEKASVHILRNKKCFLIKILAFFLFSALESFLSQFQFQGI